MTVETLNIKDLEITIVRKSIKNMYLRVRRNGDVEISASPKMKTEMIESFILSKWSWIMAKREAVLQAPSQTLATDELLYFGCPLKVKRLNASRVSIKVDGNQLLLSVPRAYSDEKAVIAAKNWMFKQLQQKIRNYMNYYWPYFEKYRISPVEVKYRQMTSTWGVYRPTRGTITFNKNLIHQPDEFIEYVVVHELSHLLQPNHSSRFYELVEHLLPQWKSFESKKVQ